MSRPRRTGRPEPPAPRAGGKPGPWRDLAAEQAREAREAEEARDAQASIRDRMVGIGRAQKQAGRQ